MNEFNHGTTRILFRDIVNRYIVPIVARDGDDIETDFGEIRLYDASIVRIIGFPLLTHEEVIGCPDRFDEFIRTVRCMTRIVSIADILDVFRMVDDDRIDSASLEPAIDHREIIITIA